MKKILTLVISALITLNIVAQELPKDVEKEFKLAQKYHKKEQLDQAVNMYKQVLRSVDYVPAMEAIGLIELEERQNPRYRIAYEFLDMAIETLDVQIASVTKNKHKKYLKEYKAKLVPKRNKAKSYIKDFDELMDKKRSRKDLLKAE